MVLTTGAEITKEASIEKLKKLTNQFYQQYLDKISFIIN